ncbi:acyl-CoA synthetase [Dietzia sp. 179-F 9C3 NHS]|uniref:acyl-CoA synthetase n=1 Tax=Dietzia sp. 179-F 9C3 NHS TaxID=3374295 RepID=UPI003878FABF
MSPNPDMNEADVFEAVADAVPDNRAVTIDGVTYSYREFDEVANRMGHLLQANGVEPGNHVALFMRNIIEHLASMVGLMKIRGVGINVNFRYTEDELAYLFADSDAVATVVEAEYADKVAAILPRCPELKTVLCVGPATEALTSACAERGVTLVDVDAELPEQSSERDFGPRSGDDTWVVYTGGTTGFPKGVVWRMADYYYACLSGGNPYGDPYNSPEEVAANSGNGAFFNVMVSAPLMHGAGTFTLFTFFNLGGHIIMQRDFDPVAILKTIEEYKAGMLVFVGDGMGVPIIDAMAENWDQIDVTSLFAVSSGGGIWSKASRDKLRSLLPDVIVRDNFGASESGNDGELLMSGEGEVRLPAGPKVMVVDDDHNPIAPGSDEVGFLVRRGHIPLGYYGDEEKTARTFPIIDGERVSVLGDMARVDEDGSIVFLGRGSGCINTGGEKVFPEEVEQALKSHPAVLDALVAGMPDPRFGQAVAAVVSLREGESASEEEIQEFVRGKLANYKVPKRVVEVDQVKRSPAGKADYRWAKEQVAPADA